jgi:hypothetical protein
MAAQTLTDVTRNYDDAAISGLLNGESITLNNSTLIIDSDVRWGQQAAVLGGIAISATLGGVSRIDGRNVWWMAYDAATGNVPTLGTAGVQNCTGGTSAATGEFLGIFTALGVAPSASGGAMPAAGFIKFRSKVGTFVDNEVVTLPGGATITVNSATGGQRGWIHFVGAESGSATVPRLGKFEALGDWFELGTTNGADDQTFQYPVLDNCPAIQIETGVGTGIYEWWLNAGSRWATATQFVPTDLRGKYYGMNNATGVITIAQRASNSCGFKPASGLRVRIPNILVSNSNATNWNLNTISGTLATRFDFITTSAGDILIDKTCGNWYLSFSSAFQVMVSNSATLHSVLVANTAGDTTFDNCAIGLNSTTEFNPMSFSNMFSGGMVQDCRVARYASSGAGNNCIAATDCAGLSFLRTSAEMFGSATAVTRGTPTAYAFLFTRCNDFYLTDCTIMGSRLEWTQCARSTCTGLKYADQINGATVATQAQSAFSISAATTNIDIDGFSNFGSLANVHPYNGFLVAVNAFFISMRNIGTAAAPYNCGSANQVGIIANVTVCTDVTFRRIYTDNLRTGAFSLANTVQRMICVNVWSDGADTQLIAAVDITPQGCRWTNSVTPQVSVYARHWEDAFTSTTAGRILIAMNEPLASTADQCAITAGTPAFTSGGQVAMKTVGDQVTWTMPYYCLGYTSLANIAPTISGTSTGNMSYEYQIDTGSGYGAYKALTGANLNGETISPTAGFKLRVRATTTVANSANVLSYIRIDGVTNATDQQVAYALPFDAAGVIAGIQTGSRVQIYNVTTSAEIYNQVVAGTSLNYQYYNGTGITAGDEVRIRITRVNGLTAYLPYSVSTIATATGFSALAAQQVDAVYNLNAINGSLVTDYVTDYPNVQIDIDDADGSTTAARLYAWFANNLTTSQGIADWFGGITAEDNGNYKIVTSILDLKLDNIRATGVLFTGEARLYRDDGEIPVVATTTGGGSIVLYAGKVYTISVGSGLSPSEQATLEKINTLTEDVGGLRFTAQALEESPAGGGGGPTAAAIADAVWDEVLSGHLTAGTTGAALNGASAPSAATVASAVRTELTTELGRIDVATSTRLATAGYTAPANSDISAIKAKTDNLPSDPADQSLIIDATNALSSQISGLPTAPSAASVAGAVRTELTTELGRIDVATSTRNAVAPLDSTATQAAAAAALTSYDPPTKAELDSAIAGIPSAPSASTNATAVRTELATELARIDVATSTRNAVAPDNAGITAIKAKTDNLPASPASETTLTARPTLAQIEASTVLAQESTVESVKQNTDLIPAAL